MWERDRDERYRPGDPQTPQDEEACHNWARDSRRLGTEMYLAATRDAIYASTDPTARQAMITTYCEGITGKYPDEYTDDFPSDVVLYLATADYSLCN